MQKWSTTKTKPGNALSLTRKSLHRGTTSQGNKIKAKMHNIRCIKFPLFCILIPVCTVYSTSEVVKNEQNEAEIPDYDFDVLGRNIVGIN